MYALGVSARNSVGEGPEKLIQPVTTRDVPRMVDDLGDGGPVNGLDESTGLHVAWNEPFDCDVPIDSYEVAMDCEENDATLSGTTPLDEGGYVGAGRPINLAGFIDTAASGVAREVTNVPNAARARRCSSPRGASRRAPSTSSRARAQRRGWGEWSKLYCVVTEKDVPGQPPPPCSSRTTTTSPWSR